MKKKRYSAAYKGKTYFVFALCEEEVYWEVLRRNGINVETCDIVTVVENEKMTVCLV